MRETPPILLRLTFFAAALSTQSQVRNMSLGVFLIRLLRVRVYAPVSVCVRTCSFRGPYWLILVIHSESVSAVSHTVSVSTVSVSAVSLGRVSVSETMAPKRASPATATLGDMLKRMTLAEDRMDEFQKKWMDLDPAHCQRTIDRMKACEGNHMAIFNAYATRAQNAQQLMEDEMDRLYADIVKKSQEASTLVEKNMSNLERETRVLKDQLRTTTSYVEDRCATILTGAINRMENEAEIAKGVLEKLTNESVETLRVASVGIEKTSIAAIRLALVSPTQSNTGELRGRLRSNSLMSPRSTRNAMVFRAQQAVVVQRSASRSLSRSSRTDLQGDMDDAQRVARMRSPPPAMEPTPRHAL